MARSPKRPRAKGPPPPTKEDFENYLPSDLKRLERVCPRVDCGSKAVEFRYFDNEKKARFKQPRFKCHGCKKTFTLGGKLRQPYHTKKNPSGDPKPGPPGKEIGEHSGAAARHTRGYALSAPAAHAETSVAHEVDHELEGTSAETSVAHDEVDELEGPSADEMEESDEEEETEETDSGEEVSGEEDEESDDEETDSGEEDEEWSMPTGMPANQETEELVEEGIMPNQETEGPARERILDLQVALQLAQDWNPDEETEELAVQGIPDEETEELVKGWILDEPGQVEGGNLPEGSEEPTQEKIVASGPVDSAKDIDSEKETTPAM